MRRLPAILVLCAWLLASGAQWDLLQGFAWGRMIASYSRTMPLAEAVRLTFTPSNLCNVCAFVAEAKTRANTDGRASDPAPVEAGAKAKPPLAAPPEHVFVFSSAPAPEWPAEQLWPHACARPAPPSEPPRAA
jgi:hypothetical protein